MMSSASASTAAPDTPPLRLGVTGHRILADAEPDALAITIDRVLAAVASIRGITCINALAAGADRLVAHAALAHGASLVAILPFSRDDYATDDATDAARADLDTLLAHATSIEALAGSRIDGAAYLAVGRRVLDESDVLLAIWDGAPERGPGGTAQVVREAEARGLPIIVIAAAAPHAPYLRLPRSPPSQIAGLADRLAHLIPPAEAK